MGQSKALDWVVLAGLVVCWGSAFALLKISTEHVAPQWNTAGRLMVAAPLLLGLLLARGERLPPITHRAWIAYAFIGFVGMTAPFFLYAYAAQRLPSAVNAICNGASPIFTALLGHAFLAGERLSVRKALGVLVAFAGLVVLVAPRLQAGFGLETAALAAALVGALFYGIANVVTKGAPAVTAGVGGFLMCFWGAVFGVGGAFAMGPPPPWPPWPAALAVVGLGVFTTGLGAIGYIFLVQRRGPLFMSMAVYMAPLWATGLGVLVLGERPGLAAFVALALILSGVALTTLSPRRA